MSILYFFINLKECPYCKERVKEEEIDYRCINEKCKGKNIEKIEYFFKEIGLKGFGKKKAEYFGDKSILEVINIMKKKEDWIKNKYDLKLFNLFNIIRYKLTIKDIIISLGIDGIGKSFINSLPLSFCFFREKNNIM